VGGCGDGDSSLHRDSIESKRSKILFKSMFVVVELDSDAFVLECEQERVDGVEEDIDDDEKEEEDDDDDEDDDEDDDDASSSVPRKPMPVLLL